MITRSIPGSQQSRSTSRTNSGPGSKAGMSTIPPIPPSPTVSGCRRAGSYSFAASKHSVSTAASLSRAFFCCPSGLLMVSALGLYGCVCVVLFSVSHNAHRGNLRMGRFKRCLHPDQPLSQLRLALTQRPHVRPDQAHLLAQRATPRSPARPTARGSPPDPPTANAPPPGSDAGLSRSASSVSLGVRPQPFTSLAFGSFRPQHASNAHGDDIKLLPVSLDRILPRGRLWNRRTTHSKTRRRVAPEDPAMDRPAAVPATADYPCSDGRPLAESDFQLKPLVYAIHRPADALPRP